MKIRFLFLLAALIFALFSCSDPVFYTISQEVEPIEPLIKGAPINFVVFNGKMYTASGSTLYYYIGGSPWNTGPNPGGTILQLAKTENYLYALCLVSEEARKINTVLRRFDNSEWTDIPKGEFQGTIKNIFSAKDCLFIGNEDNNSFSAMYLSDTDAVVKNLNIGTNFGTLTGAAWDGANYFLSTGNYYDSKDPVGGGIFTTSDPSGGAALIGGENNHFTGLINLSSNVVAAITRDGGEIYTVTSSGITRVGEVSMGDYKSTGALAVWVDKADPSRRLLLAGRQDKLEYTTDSGYTYGYLELELDSNGIKSGAEYTEPGLKDPSSIMDNDNERYKSTIGKYPVNHLFQAPEEVDSNMTLFASTQKNGVFSYRIRNEIWQWNAEQ